MYYEQVGLFKKPLYDSGDYPTQISISVADDIDDNYNQACGVLANRISMKDTTNYFDDSNYQTAKAERDELELLRDYLTCKLHAKAEKEGRLPTSMEMIPYARVGWREEDALLAKEKMESWYVYIESIPEGEMSPVTFFDFHMDENGDYPTTF